MTTGWQVDRSYVPCPSCRWAPKVERHAAPGTPTHMPGTTHYGDCPTIPRLSREDERALQLRLDDMDRMRRRGAATAHTFVIG